MISKKSISYLTDNLLRRGVAIATSIRKVGESFGGRVTGEGQVVLGVVVFGMLFLARPLVVNAGDPSAVLGVSDTAGLEFVKLQSNPRTVSRLSEKKVVVTEEIPFETKYEEDDDLEWGKEERVQEGKEGERKLTYRVSYWYGEEMGRELINTEIREPQPEIIKRGTKIKWREVPGKGYKYWAKLEDCWATSYDGNCEGCRGLTYSGTKVKHGVCAVDPDVIPLGTNFYVPGYGICRAEDIGGAIDGNDVDLGFRDVRKGFWSARHVDVYLLTNAPE